MKIEPVTAPDPVPCPHCGEALSSRAFDQAQTLDPLTSLDPSVHVAYLLWGPCSACGQTVHAIELGIAAPEAPGRFLIIDNAHKAGDRKFYRITWKSRSWTAEHFTGVTEASYEDGTGALDWLDIHHLHIFAADKANPFDIARTFARTYGPRLVTLWDEGGGSA